MKVGGIHVAELVGGDAEEGETLEEKFAFAAEECLLAPFLDYLFGIGGDEGSETTLVEDDALAFECLKCTCGSGGVNLLRHCVVTYAGYLVHGMILMGEYHVTDSVGETNVYRSVVSFSHTNYFFMKRCTIWVFRNLHQARAQHPAISTIIITT